jgi:hypothetical protein
MERHTPLGGYRGCITQGVERLAHGGFFSQGEQCRPDARADGDSQPNEAQRGFGKH